jgi:hypothetical protein
MMALVRMRMRNGPAATRYFSALMPLSSPRHASQVPDVFSHVSAPSSQRKLVPAMGPVAAAGWNPGL